MNRDERRAAARAGRRHRHRWVDKSWGVQAKCGEWERVTTTVCIDCGAERNEP